MTVRLPVALILVTMLALAGAFPAEADFTGSLSSGDNEVDGQGHWIDPGPTDISWNVVWEPAANAWRYSYTLSVPRFAISHWIIEVSDDFVLSDIWNVEGQHTTIELSTFDSTQGNPGMPGFIYGIKLDGYEWNGGDGLTADLSFHSRRNPVWADFYAKCGGGAAQNAAWNMGLTPFEDDDPTNPPSDGSVANHILAPNGYIPEPTTTALFGIGIATLVGFHRRRKSQS